MLHNANANWVKNRVALYLALLISIAVVIAAYLTHQNLLWMLAASVPLLCIGIYIARSQYAFLNQPPLRRFRSSFQNNKINEADLNIVIGNEQCSKPYKACFLNFETKTQQRFSSFDKPATENQHNYYLADGGRVWQMRPDYTGCKTLQGNFNCDIFRGQSRRSEIKMIELNLSPESASFHSTNTRAAIANNNSQSMFYAASAYNVFRNAEAMILFLKTLRKLSGGKPVGLRLSPHNKKDFYSICYAICKTQILPDFIVVEGLHLDTSKPHLYQHPEEEKCLYESLLFVDETLRHYGIRSKIKIIASGKIAAAFDIFKLITAGADGVLAIRQEDEKDAGILYSNKRNSLSHKELFRTTLELMNSFRFTSVSDVTLANFFSKLKIEQPQTVSMQNNVSMLSGPVVKPDTLIIRSVETKNKNEPVLRLKKTQKDMLFYKM